MGMLSVLPVFFVLGFCTIITHSAPWRNFAVQHSQVCGDKLADMLALVCEGRGYNFAFKTEHTSARRIRRGIVEECCHKSCTPALLELYCQAATDPPSNVQIRKRSDSEVESSEHQLTDDTTKLTTSELEGVIKHTQDSQIMQRESMTTPSLKEGGQNYKFINLLASSEHSTHRHSTKINKSTPNDTTEEEFFKKSNIPLLRHHKNHHHRRQYRNRKASTKTKRDKNLHGESTKTFEIGTVKPYFAGRGLVSYRSSYSQYNHLL